MRNVPSARTEQGVDGHDLLQQVGTILGCPAGISIIEYAKHLRSRLSPGSEATDDELQLLLTSPVGTGSDEYNEGWMHAMNLVAKTLAARRSVSATPDAPHENLAWRPPYRDNTLSGSLAGTPVDRVEYGGATSCGCGSAAPCPMHSTPIVQGAAVVPAPGGRATHLSPPGRPPGGGVPADPDHLAAFRATEKRMRALAPFPQRSGDGAFRVLIDYATVMTAFFGEKDDPNRWPESLASVTPHTEETPHG